MKLTRGQLLAEAEVLVRRRGYAGFSYADLAAVVGVSKAAIHHHFRAKDDLACALVASYGARYTAALADIHARGPDAMARIEAYGALYLGGVEQGLGCLCAVLAVERDQLPPVLRDAISAFFAAHIAWLGEVLRAGQAEGSIRSGMDPQSGARLVLATLEGALLTERMLTGAAGFERVLEALRTVLKP